MEDTKWFWFKESIYLFFEKYLGGLSLGPFTLYGFNAMHLAIQISTYRWGYICFHPPLYWRGRWWGWYFYLSPNATPWASTFAIGSGVERKDKLSAPLRRKKYGFNFKSELLQIGRDGEWL